MVASAVIMSVNYSITDGRYFQTTYGMYIERAEDYEDAQMIKDSLNQALFGIEQLGLEPDDSYRILWFTDTGYSRVETMILDIESVLLACDQVLLWLDDIHNESVTKEIGTDIYSVKIQNLQAMASNIDGRQHRVQHAWFIKHNRGWLNMWWFNAYGLPFLVASLAVAFTGETSKSDYDLRNQERLQQFKKDNKLFGIW